jgi:hypothetical protein
MKPGWSDAVDHFTEGKMMAGTAELRFLSVIKVQLAMVNATPPPISLALLLETLDTVPKESYMLPWTSRLGSIHMTLGSMKLQSDNALLLPYPTGLPICHRFPY